MKYRVEASIETKRSLTTVRTFDNAEDCRDWIRTLPEDCWWVLEHANTGVEIAEYNYTVKDNTIHYKETVAAPKALQNIESKTLGRNAKKIVAELEGMGFRNKRNWNVEDLKEYILTKFDCTMEVAHVVANEIKEW